MTYEGTVHGVLVVSKDGGDQFDADDETTLTIFAGYAAQAIVNATNMQRLQRQQRELEHQLDGQRRLLEVNERLLSTLEPAGVLDLIADSLKAIVPYDSLTVYRVDRVAGVRRAVIARDRFAELILAHESPLGVGITGWVIDHGEAVCANEAHLDPRSVQVPGTPFEPEAMIVVPLLVDGEAIGTLNIGRMGEAEAAFTPERVRADPALRRPGVDRPPERRDPRRGPRPGRAGRPDRAAQPRLVPARAGRGDRRRRTAVRDPHARPRRVQGVQRRLRPPGRRRPAGGHRADHDRGHPRRRPPLPLRRRRVRGDPPGRRPEVGPRGRRADPARRRRPVRRHGRSAGHDQRRGRLLPGRRPDQGRAGRRWPTRRCTSPSRRGGFRGHQPRGRPVPAALDETALALLDRHDQDDLLETILARATALLGTPHGFIYLAEPDEEALVVRHGTGVFTEFLGFRLPIDKGLSGHVFRTGKPLAIDDYDAWSGRANALPSGMFGAVVGVPLTTAGRVVGVLGLASGATERRWGPREIGALTSFAQLASIALDNARLVDEAQRGALYDLTTGLPNRELLTDRIAHALASSRPDGPESIGVILLDLDRFKVINETLGHAVGDRLLVAVGQRLVACLRPGDTVARFGGDEFGIILDEVADSDEAHRIAERIGAELRAPFSLGDREWFISASLGIALGRPGRATPDEMLREAEIAMVRAKADPANRYALFEPSMTRQTIERIDLENDLRRGIERGELRLHYQPLVDLATDRIVGFEALVRWQHPIRGLIPPLAFIPLAEETGLIVPLGRWVLERACRQARAWHDARPGGPPLFMSVNLSARQFAQPELVDQVREILDETGLDPAALELEITESVLMDQTEAGVRTLRQLRDLGVRLVLDDFGTGYSSLSYLKHLPLDTIKIDRTFVAGLEGETDRSIVEAVIALAHGLGSASSPRASRPRRSSSCCERSAATSARATSSRDRSRRSKPVACCPAAARAGRHAPATPGPARRATRLVQATAPGSIDESRRRSDAERWTAPGEPEGRRLDRQLRLPSSRSMNRNRLMKSRYRWRAPITAAFSIEPVRAARSPAWIRWTSYAVSAVKITTPTIEMIHDSMLLPRNRLISEATIRPIRPMNRMPPSPASERLVRRAVERRGTEHRGRGQERRRPPIRRCRP